MFEVNTPEGVKFLVQLVGPASYRMGSQVTYRGSTLTVTKRTRDYLVRKTKGAWADFDPTPEEPVEEYFPPQFGEPGGPSIDMGDIDPEKNPALTMGQARQLAMRTGNIPDATPDTPDLEDLSQKAAAPEALPEGRGDMTAADLKEGQKARGSGGKTAQAKAKPAGGVNVTTKPAQKATETATTVE